MRCSIIIALCVSLIAFFGIPPAVGGTALERNPSDPRAADRAQEVTWEVPIAAGIYYPGEGRVPEAPMRYYRVRCWPGCHTGSTLGKYPDKKLKYDPIFPTSTVSGHTGRASREGANR